MAKTHTSKIEMTVELDGDSADVDINQLLNFVMA